MIQKKLFPAYGLFFSLICLACLALGSCDSATQPPKITAHAITFNANGGSGSMSAQTIEENASANLAANAFTRTGYTFSGWATTATALTAYYGDKALYTMGSTDVTLFAVWTIVPVTTHAVSFNANGGAGTMAAQTIAENTSANLTANAFTRAGYTFLGWATTSSATVAVFADSASYAMGTSDVTLYAVWEIIPTQVAYNIFRTFKS
jgi:uncharacterized repeat protein (TIGR02543 family)